MSDQRRIIFNWIDEIVRSVPGIQSDLATLAIGIDKEPMVFHMDIIHRLKILVLIIESLTNECDHAIALQRIEAQNKVRGEKK